MTKNDIIDVLKASMRNEIENEYVIKENTIEVKLPNCKTAIIKVQSTKEPCITHYEKIIYINNYVFSHDYGDIGENNPQKLFLRNLQDVEAYIVDVIETNVIDVEVYNGIVIDMHNLIVQIVVELA